jgi:hypothetical protein
MVLRNGGKISQKVYQRVSRPLGIFFQHPMAGVFENNDGGIGRNDFQLLPENLSVCSFAANR